MNARRAFSVAIALASLASAATAQSWRTLSAERAIGKEDSLRVLVRYGLGKLTVRPAAPAVLYDLDVRYDADVFRVERRYDQSTRTLTVGADSATAERFSLRPHFFGGNTEKSAKGGFLTLGLARGIPIDLTIKVGAGAGVIDVGELSLEHLHVEATMGAAVVTFSTPGSKPVRQMEFEALMGGVILRQLGNAHAQRVKITAALGGSEVDLSGDWTGEMTIDAQVTLGGLELHVPRDVGVKVTARGKLGGVDAKGFTRRGGVSYSANWSTAARKLTVEGTATLGGIEVNWVEP